MTTRAHAHVTNEAGYAAGKPQPVGMEVAASRRAFASTNSGTVLEDKVNPVQSGVQLAGRWQGKGSIGIYAISQDAADVHMPIMVVESTVSTLAGSSRDRINPALRRLTSIR